MKTGSLCSGYAGLDLAVEAATGAQPVWFSDIDNGAKKILAHHWPNIPNHGDLTAINWAEVEPIDILTAGYPCQPFSKAGKRKGTDDERHLWPHLREAIRHLRPRITILENVAGHRSLGFGRVLGDLAEDGMHVQWTSLRAADVGAPHSRERVFLVITNPDSQGHGAAAFDRGVLGRLAGKDEGETQQRQRTRTVPGNGIAPNFGRYSDAVARWERLLGRPAPVPMIDAIHENPRFSEWMMGLPDGWVTLVPGLSHNEQLKAIGNGVCPQQAYAAITSMIGAIEVAA